MNMKVNPKISIIQFHVYTCMSEFILDGYECVDTELEESTKLGDWTGITGGVGGVSDRDECCVLP